MITKIRIEEAIGHGIKREDIAEFLNIGKESVYVVTHEEDAAFAIAYAPKSRGLRV